MMPLERDGGQEVGRAHEAELLSGSASVAMRITWRKGLLSTFELSDLVSICGLAQLSQVSLITRSRGIVATAEADK
jgi:hypothetical protein